MTSRDAAPPILFDRDVRRAYAPVRACRSPGEHSGLNAFTVWVDRPSAPAFDGIWKDPPSPSVLPAGTLLVKEIYAGSDCVASDVEHWVVMKKEPGFDPPHGDWHWQKVLASGKVETDGADGACIGCHVGTASCDGFGKTGGRDYTCTVP